MWWHPQQFSQKRQNLAVRQQILKAIRGYFDAQGFDEVDTPILQICPVIDTHIRAFATDLRGVDGDIDKTMYLHTSPEFAMKKLMVAGMEKIYQICHVFRNAEGSKRHTPEFTMIEWYRTQADYEDIMEDCVGLLRSCAGAANVKEFRYKEHQCNPFTEWQRLSVCEAFEQYADIDLKTFLDDTEGFRGAVRDLGLHAANDDGWDDLFFRVMDAKIEPFLGMERPTFLCDYPISMASLSKPKNDDPRFAERFELYVCGIELANAFSELTDAAEQRKRYDIEMAEKQRLYGETYPLDEEFIAALEYGLPPSGGIALGIDRLVMLATGQEDIKNVNWCEI
ncbi:MAG TPA: EF-P lysine aminoacylase EpmA [Alphaproteobacteria bacterium]|nr:EF-P lysine aminoacylase EpmA [Alphaproteobacteria bacterium]